MGVVVDLKISIVVCIMCCIIACGGDNRDSYHNRDVREPFTARWQYSNNPRTVKWTSLTYDAIEKHGRNLLEIIPADIDEFCPQYGKFSRETRKRFWVFFVSAISELESRHNPDVIYREQFRDRYGKRVSSRGLLQLSRESALGYGCEFSSEKDLHDPALNLRCGVQILNQCIGKDERITGKVEGEWQGGARYWSSLRDEEKVRQLKAWIRETCICNKF